MIKTAHRSTPVAALIMMLAIVFGVSGFVGQSSKARPEDSTNPCPSASEQGQKFMPRVTSSTSTALISGLSVSADPSREAVLIGRMRVEDMVIQLEMESAKAMPTITDSPPKLSKNAAGKGELYHVRVTPSDPRSNRRISYSKVTFHAVNKDNGREIKGELHPMWGRRGFHYAFNSGLAGDGVYESKVIVGVPTFARDLRYQDRWLQPVAAKFHFTLANGMLAEASKPIAD